MKNYEKQNIGYSVSEKYIGTEMFHPDRLNFEVSSINDVLRIIKKLKNFFVISKVTDSDYADVKGVRIRVHLKTYVPKKRTFVVKGWSSTYREEVLDVMSSKEVLPCKIRQIYKNQKEADSDVF